MRRARCICGWDGLRRWSRNRAVEDYQAHRRTAHHDGRDDAPTSMEKVLPITQATGDVVIAAIRERDAAYGENIPAHWQGPSDRRVLLELIDQLLLNRRLPVS